MSDFAPSAVIAEPGSAARPPADAPGHAPNSDDDARIEELVTRCESIQDEDLRDDMIELLQRVLALHAAGLRRMLDSGREAPHPAALHAAWKRDPAIQALCQLHGLELGPPPASPTPGFVPLSAL